MTYTLGLHSTGAMLDEARTLAAAWSETDTSADVIRRAVSELGKSTSNTATHYARAFLRRFGRDGGGPARTLQMVLPLSGRAFRELALLYTCDADEMLRDWLADLYWPLANGGRVRISLDLCDTWLLGAIRAGRCPGDWSPGIYRSLPGRLLSAAERFALLGPTQGRIREITAWKPHDHSLIIAAHVLHEQGLTSAEVLDHHWWAAWGMSRETLIARIRYIAYSGMWDWQQMGSTQNWSWRYATARDAFNALRGS